MAEVEMAVETVDPPPARTLRGLFWYFLGLGSFGFGGPIALAGYMHRDLVVARGWHSDDEYQQRLAIAQTMPGALAAQLTSCLGLSQRCARDVLLLLVLVLLALFLIRPAVSG